MGIFVVFLAVTLSAQPASRTSPVGSYSSGIYHNLFSEVAGIHDSVVIGRIHSTFQQLFYGDDSQERIYYPAGPNMAYIEDVNNKDVRTEGMSYGMMICVQLDKKSEFDRLWKWAKVHMQFQQGPHKGYFGWHCRPDGTVMDSTAASDGEEWFVMSLLFASSRWGDGEGIFNYRKEAEQILHTMLHKEEQSDCGDVTNMFDAKTNLIAFVPRVGGSSFSDPSYHVPHFYELWGRWAASDNRFWCDAAIQSRLFLRKSADSTTGLCPDYAHFDGTPVSRWPGEHDDFRFDAWRVAMNIGLDYSWFAKDPWEVTECNKLLDFFASQGTETYGNQYSLKGEKLAGDHSPGLVAMNAVAALASTNANRIEFVRAFWHTPVPRGPYRYYDGVLYMLGLLQVSGNFRIYGPSGQPQIDCAGR